jgi:hypothetical protein
MVIATQKSNTFLSNISGIPDNLNVDSRDTPIGQIKFEPDTNWIFNVKVFDRCLGEGCPFIHLVIESAQVSLRIQYNGNSVNFKMDAPDLHINSPEYALTNYSIAVDEGLKIFIAAHNFQLTKAKQ